MTKRVRIENADTGEYVVIVQVWDKGQSDDPAVVAPDTLAKEVRLANPADMTDSDIYITDTRYLVIKEE